MAVNEEVGRLPLLPSDVAGGAPPRQDVRFGGLRLAEIASTSRYRPVWLSRYQRILVAADAIVLLVALTLAFVLRFEAPGISDGVSSLNTSYILVSVAFFGAWLVALGLGDTRDARVIGIGNEEYVKVFNVTFVFFGLIAILGYVLRVDLARGYVAIALPVGLLLLLGSRFALRRWLHYQRDHGHFQAATIVVGGRAAAAHLIRELKRVPREGYRVVGVCVPGGRHFIGETIAGATVLGDLDSAAAVARRAGADTVAVTASDAVTPDVVRRLSWDIEPAGAQLVVAPSLMDVAGPRIHTRPVAGLPLLHVEAPGYVGIRHKVKACFDWFVGALLALVLLPVMAVIALAIKVTSPGPVIFRQERVGRAGETFHMLKFRSMVVDAEQRLAALQDENEGNGLLFKMKNDPRVTPIGRILRRLSLDELPQIFNVLRGEMSLVGPRPPLVSEVDLYDADVSRRLLVKPGITGLWQVSGRSDLSLEESVRLDLYYVENWTFFGDILILLRTAAAVVKAKGAY